MIFRKASHCESDITLIQQFNKQEMYLNERFITMERSKIKCQTSICLFDLFF